MGKHGSGGSEGSTRAAGRGPRGNRSKTRVLAWCFWQRPHQFDTLHTFVSRTFQSPRIHGRTSCSVSMYVDVFVMEEIGK